MRLYLAFVVLCWREMGDRGLAIYPSMNNQNVTMVDKKLHIYLLPTAVNQGG